MTELRRRKARGDKPFALMAADLADIEPLVHLGPLERELLAGSVRPVVLLRRRDDARPRPGAAPALAVAPGSPDLGFMLPYTPVHHLLLGLGAPDRAAGPRLLVMTSGNLSGEPIVTDDAEALTRLAGLADAWLLHDRPIHVPCDDSVVRVCDGEQLTLRRSRGYAPLPVTLPVDVAPALAVGGDLKNTFCLGEGRQAWLSAHIGDMDDLATQLALASAERQLESVTGVRPGLLAVDRHPAYRSTRWARRHAAGRPVVPVQHHHAHVAAAMAENGLDGTRPVIGVAFDGTGYGPDGAVWGGEFLVADYAGFSRFAHLAYVPLPGGDAAVRRPYRMALAHLRAAGLAADPGLPCTRACVPGELTVLERQLARELNCVPTSSMGRLFDAVSSLAGICHHAGYEAQAAIELEAAALRAPDVAEDGRYAFRLGSRRARAPLTADPAPLLTAVAADVLDGIPTAVVAARFHRAVARLVRTVCAAARSETGVETVALTGECSRTRCSPRPAPTDCGRTASPCCAIAGSRRTTAVWLSASSSWPRVSPTGRPPARHDESDSEETPMCLAVPGKVLDVEDRDGTRMATVDFGGVVKEVCLEYLPDLKPGEYAIVHVGFALQRLDEESARRTLELFETLGMLQEEFGDPWEAAEATGNERPAQDGLAGEVTR